ncbi:ATP-dependent endonuclease [Amycolatopsis sp. FDAARGOS 1241]|uniref:ATP-dependent nuclease n=1 Tax=Amycolatopsis sp. FDAARGOS 1241 TaxID=2778070 RepID=UPI001950A984|nr:AAA family ATPase [Amycolatopsis sp. FDAARGOS 1241]QRP43070.1 AAA family ATPase [Amycolatopsis sp. FDAARGOS 1241]
MHLEHFSVSGFRSLIHVREVPVSSPTIIAGHNDGGKTALLDALAFLLNEGSVDEQDRSFLPDDPSSRFVESAVEGTFSLDEWEQETLRLPGKARIRRVARNDGVQLQAWTSVPADERLRTLGSMLLPDLQGLAKELELKPASNRKADVVSALRQYGLENAAGEDWLPMGREVTARLPRLVRFDGTVDSPNDTVKSVLNVRFQTHTEDPGLQGKLSEIADELSERLRTEAKDLCQHIKKRCPELTEVNVEPEIQLHHGLRRTELRFSRGAGGEVGLNRAGLGSGRRVSLAVWEWTKLQLKEQSDTEARPEEHGESAPSPVQTIIVYDEPDTHLDYANQRRVMDLIREQSAIPNVNVIVATHSMNLIDGVDIADVIHLKLVDDATVVERLGADSHADVDGFLGKVSASVGLRNSVLLHERCFVAVEGDTEMAAFPLLFKLSEGITLQAAGIALWGCGNHIGALRLAEYLVKHKRRVQLVIDADSRRQPMFKDSTLRQYFGPDLTKYVSFLGEDDDCNELEELFPDEQWAETANLMWPREDAPWTPPEFAAHRSKKFSEDVKEMVKAGSLKGPGGKAAMMADLALSLRSPEQIPDRLRTLFADLRSAARC